MAPWWRPRARAEERLSQEIAFHLDARVAELLADGVPREQAERQARRELGSIDPILEACRDQRWWRGLDDLSRDLRYAIRALRGAPVFALVALLTLTLGIGANAALFQVYEALVVRSLPLPDPAALHVIRVTPGTPRNGNFSGRLPHLTSAQVDVLRRTAIARDGLAVWSSFRFNRELSGEARLAQTLLVSGDYFQVLGVQAQRGRLLVPADDQRGCSAGAAVISDALWRREFGRDDAVLGQRFPLGGQVFEIVGVAPAGFAGLDVGRDFDVAVPLCAEPLLRGERTMTAARQNWWLAAVARLPRGESLEARAASLAALSPTLFRETLPPEFRPELAERYLAFTLTAVDARRGVSSVRDRFTDPLLLLMGVTVTVLLIACVNLANLLLARMSHRQRELAVRLAVGASRARLARVVAVEASVLALAGTLAGVLVSLPFGRWLVMALATTDQRVHLDVRANWPLVAAAAGMAVAVCAICAVAPALRAAAVPPLDALRHDTRTTAGRRTLWWRRALIVTEVALTFVLVVGAALMARTLGALQSVDLGFDARGVIATELDFTRVTDWTSRRQTLLDAMQDRLAGLPFVRGVSTLDYVPIAGSSWDDTVRVEGGGPPDVPSQLNRVGEAFFQVMETPLVEGRLFTAQDRPGTPAVAVVNRAYRDRAFPDTSPIGRQVRFLSDPARVYEIVGVVGDTKYGTLRETRQPVVFVATRQQTPVAPYVSLIVRTGLPADAAAPTVRAALLEIAPALSMETRALEAVIDDALHIERLLTRLSAFFGVLALLLAGIGLYGVIAYTAAQRRHDIGIRLALGASRTGVVWQVVGQTGWLVLLGLVVGVSVCVPLSRWIEALLFGVSARDALTYAAAAVLLLAVGLGAAWMPAWRASRLNPTAALRSQ